MTLMLPGCVSAPLELAIDQEALPAPVSRPGNQRVGTAPNWAPGIEAPSLPAVDPRHRSHVSTLCIPRA